MNKETKNITVAYTKIFNVNIFVIFINGSFLETIIVYLVIKYIYTDMIDTIIIS
jgi:hypothetical protein